MSMSQLLVCPCPACGAEQRLRIYESVNASARADLRDAARDGSFPVRTCEACSEHFFIPAELTWFDLDQGIWVKVLPPERARAWREAEMEVQVQYFSTFGPLAPSIAQELGARVSSRVVFGWAALREKILCAQHGLDDAALEIVKLLALTARVGQALGDDSEWRLIEVSDEALRFAVLATGLEVVVDGFDVPRAALAQVVAQPEAWAEARSAIVGEGFYVDINRVLLAEETPGAGHASLHAA